MNWFIGSSSGWCVPHQQSIHQGEVGRVGDLWQQKYIGNTSHIPYVQTNMQHSKTIYRLQCEQTEVLPYM